MTNLLNHFYVIEKLGEGSFGSVWRCQDKLTGELVAIKMMKQKYHNKEECLNHPEVRSLTKLKHPNIVKLKKVIKENNNLFLVYESMESSLWELMHKSRKPFTEDEVRSYVFQLFLALAYMHQHGYFHRDLKPDNFLVSSIGRLIKIADFGMAHEVSLSGETPYMGCVTTRWYRAPEVLLCSSYTPAIDMWAMGAILAELFTSVPMFPGVDEKDQIYRICSVIGTPNEESWADGILRAKAFNFQFPMSLGCNLSCMIPRASKEAIDLIVSLCSWDPYKRLTAAEALQHPFFASCFYIPPSIVNTQNVVTAAARKELIALEEAIHQLAIAEAAWEEEMTLQERIYQLRVAAAATRKAEEIALQKAFHQLTIAAAPAPAPAPAPARKAEEVAFRTHQPMPYIPRSIFRCSFN